MKFSFFPLAFVLMASAATASPFYDVSPFGSEALRCINGECEAAISKTTYGNSPAYKLTNGAVEAIVVPSVGRVMSFGKIGGPNLLWNAQASQIAKSGWKNYGGDKTWLAPQENWPSINGSKSWPPDDAFDGQSQKSEVLSGGKLQLTTPLSQTGIRIVRTLYFDDNGEFVIEQSATKESGAPLRAGLWSITQIVPGQAVFAAVDPNTQYADGFYRFDDQSGPNATLVKPNLARIEIRADGKRSKFGFDTPIAALASVRNGVALVQKAARPDGQYPDGKNGNGFPSELYLNGEPERYYQELEILAPLQNLKIGDSQTHTVRWSLHNLPSTDVNSPEVIAALEKLLLKN